jgi:hypothetical protein
MTKYILGLLAVLAALAPAKAEVETLYELRGTEIRNVFRLKFSPPAGWEDSEQGLQQFGLPVYVPKGQTFHHAPAIIYIRVSDNFENRPVSAFIEVSQARWKKTVPDTQVTKVASEKRDNGLGEFLVYNIRNPSHPKQGWEMLAYGEDKDKDGKKYFVMISITATSQKALDDAEKAYRAALRSH